MTMTDSDSGRGLFPETAPRFLDLHVLHSSPFANLNRDDLGLPKETMYGGTRRARVSSQCLKRAVRLACQERHDVESAVRTRRLPLDVADLLVAGDSIGAWTPERAAMAASALLASVGIKAYKDTPTTDVLTFLPESAAGGIARLAREHESALSAIADKMLKKLNKDGDAGEEGKAKEKFGKVVEDFGKVLSEHPKAGKALQRMIDVESTDRIHKGVEAITMSTNPMIALFGRMLTAMPDSNVDGAAQVAHAFTTHEAVIDSDYFTTVDDSSPRDDPGAGFLDVNSYTSGVFYKYATIDLRDLWLHMGGNDEAARLVAHTAASFAAAFATEMSSAKKTVTAPHTPPVAVLAVARGKRPASYAYAFECPVGGSNGFASPSIRRLLEADDEQVSAVGQEPSWTYINGVVFDLEPERDITPLGDIEAAVEEYLGDSLTCSN